MATLYLAAAIAAEAFFQDASLNPHAHLITGLICGYRIEDIQDALTRKVRYLDKLVDELAKGRKMEKILRGAAPASPRVPRPIGEKLPPSTTRRP